MGLRGNLATMPLTDVLQWVAMGKKTGVLEALAARGATKRVWFQDGAVSAVGSSDPREFFGQFLIARGVLTENQLRMAMETQAATRIKLGRILVRAGILDEPDLCALLERKAREGVYDLFLWEEGEFAFEETPPPHEDDVPMALEVMGLVLEGIRRKDEWGRIRAAVKGPRTIFGRRGDRFPASDLALEPDLERFYGEVDGHRPLEEIALHLHCGEFQASEWAFRLLAAGFLEAVGESPERDPVPAGLVPSLMVQEGERLLEQGRREEAASHARWALRSDAYNPAARALLDRAEAGFVESFYLEVAPKTAVPELGVPLAHLQGYSLTPQEGFLVTRIDGSWDIATILQVSPFSQSEALHALKRLLELGVLQLKAR